MHGLLIWAVLGIGREADFRSYVAFVTAGMLLLTSVVTGWLIYHDPLRKIIPCAPNGKLDLRGPDGSPICFYARFRVDRPSGGLLPAGVLRMTPLTAGLAMVLVRGLPDSTALLLLFPGVLFSTVAAMAAGANCSYLVATWHWEQEAWEIDPCEAALKRSAGYPSAARCPGGDHTRPRASTPSSCSTIALNCQQTVDC